MVDEELNAKKAAEYLGASESFLKNSGEILPVQKGRRKVYLQQDLDAWKQKRGQRTFFLDLADYAKCFDFALAMHYRGYTAADWGTSRKREAGQNLTNWMRGQLGEIAVQKFFKREFNLDLELDFNLHAGIVAQDIIGIKEGSEIRKPKMRVAVKATKFKNSYLILGTADVEPENRKLDIYILTRINLPDDHLLRIAKEELEELLKKERHFELYKEQLKCFEPIPCEVAGFAYRKELEKIDDAAKLAKILGARNPVGARYVKISGELRSSKEDWEKVAEKL